MPRAGNDGDPAAGWSAPAIDLTDDRNFRDRWRISLDVRGIHLDPFARDFRALLDACLILQTVIDIPPSPLPNSM